MAEAAEDHEGLTDMDTGNPIYPFPSRQQLQRESDRSSARDDAAKDMAPINDVFTAISGLAKHLHAIAPQLPPKAAYWAEFHAGGLDDWLHDARSDIGGMVKQYHGVE